MSPPDVAPQLLDHIMQAPSLQCFSGICCLVLGQCDFLKAQMEHVTLYSISSLTNNAFANCASPRGLSQGCSTPAVSDDFNHDVARDRVASEHGLVCAAKCHQGFHNTTCQGCLMLLCWLHG